MIMPQKEKHITVELSRLKRFLRETDIEDSEFLLCVENRM